MVVCCWQGSFWSKHAPYRRGGVSLSSKSDTLTAASALPFLWVVQYRSCVLESVLDGKIVSVIS